MIALPNDAPAVSPLQKHQDEISRILDRMTHSAQAVALQKLQDDLRDVPDEWVAYKRMVMRDWIFCFGDGSFRE